jgi:cell division protein FtsQ
MARRLGAELSGARSLGRMRIPALPRWDSARRFLLIGLALLLVLGAAYMFWFRDSSFVQVEQVEVVGADAAPDIAAKLTAAAGEMTTLHVDADALREAVADDPAVLSISTDADFPHGLRIEVDLRRPAGYLEADGGTVVAADGVVLASGVDQPEDLPTIEADGSVIAGDRAEGAALTAARVLGVAPDPLLPLVESAEIDGEGSPIVTLDGGIELRFGTPAQADLKWRAAATVLADSDVDVASYIDLSVPARPVLG